MRKSESFTVQVNRVTDEIMRESGNQIGAILSSMLTAAFNCGLVYPVHITLRLRVTGTC